MHSRHSTSMPSSERLNYNRALRRDTMTAQIRKLHKTINYQRRYLLAMRKKAATCTNSMRWSMYMHKCKAIKKELRYNCGVLRTLLKLNRLKRNCAAVVIQDQHNKAKRHHYMVTPKGLRYNQSINGTLQYEWQGCPENHGYYHLYQQRVNSLSAWQRMNPDCEIRPLN